MITYILIGILALWCLIMSILLLLLYRRDVDLTMDGLLEWQEEFETEIKLKYNELITYLADLSERIEGVLKPMIKRNSGRENREKQLNSEEPLRKGGMIRPSEYKKYGFTQ